MHYLLINPLVTVSISSPLLSPPDIVAGEALLSREKIPGDCSVLVSTEILSVLFVSLPEPVLMDGCYWLLMSA